ncbi:hypothetical protein FKR84_09720 [Haloflavibacter putidus]|uniref:Uncharacterized protein n=1 Tax=Haloflavibacter putidus TaxID=2576776 RepID=A0A507ZM34_9FLAO|nr:hypothetical protein FKR84_09720 [Haloflavibacter putidus]
MFSQGQLLFAVFFVIVFAIVMVISYRKDLNLHKKYYKGSLFILIGFLLFIVALFIIKKFTH